MLIGREGIKRLKRAAVIVFGLGGVGSYAAEAIVRSGIGTVGIVDNDDVCITNINRQLIATHSAYGKPKVELMSARLHDINKNVHVKQYNFFYAEDTAGDIHLTDYEYIIDAIDTVQSKLTLIENAKSAGIPVISCMGAGNKLDPTMFKVADISKTSHCPLAKAMRQKLSEKGISDLKVVYSEEEPMKPERVGGPGCEYEVFCKEPPSCRLKISKNPPGSMSFVPPVVGMIAAGEVIKDLIGLQ